ncbi:Polyamine N-acetyltransferase 1 [Dionaea muscipula]
MESTLSPSTALLTISKTMRTCHSSFSNPILSHLRRHYSANHRLLARSLLRAAAGGVSSQRLSYQCIGALSSLRYLCAVVLPARSRFACLSSSASASFPPGVSGGGGSGDVSGGGGGGGGEGGFEGGDAKAIDGSGAPVDLSALSTAVIILDVGGMSCGGCAASVKRILESQPQVSYATVNLTTETAIVWPVSEAKAAPNWQRKVGEMLAKHLTSCGFQSNIRGSVSFISSDFASNNVTISWLGDISDPHKLVKLSVLDFVGSVRGQMKEIFHSRNTKDSTTSWSPEWSFQCWICLAFVDHIGFCTDSARDSFFRVFERKINEKHNQLKESGRGLAVSWALCAVCLLGRQLIHDGLKSLFRGSPNMNTLVGLGALSSFTVSSLAAFIPKLGWKAFFEEPIMLIAFVLLGRNLEQRAKIKATSDLTGLLSILPTKARLLVNIGEGSVSTVEVSCADLAVGDQIVVLPGDRIPADGMVIAGRSAVDESSFTGEPLPVTKLPGADVAAGSINLNGTLTVEVRRAGGETTMGDIVRLVEEAQIREAPVQRLADKVAGHFTYGVMAFSAATFMFWSLFGTHVLPSAIYAGNAMSLALQLSCSVLVVACPCALGLATPTAVLVGTSLGATRGLLLRGGHVLEKFSMANVVVFDKTGTLTTGKPVVTTVLTLRSNKTDTEQYSPYFSDTEVLTLAAAVESNTIHPVGRAIVEAAKLISIQKLKVDDGTYLEEPGSGASATVDNKVVSVGTLDWVRRHGGAADLNPFQELLEEHKSQSNVFVGINGAVAGVIYIEDQIRDDAKHVVDSLCEQGIGVYMLSGDKQSTAEYVASIVGIPRENVISGVKPDEKKRFISSLRDDGKGKKKIVAMVGDGINDAAALASADIGIAMAEGVGAASEVSSIVLLGNRLSQVLDALELSRLTMKTVKQNLWWAFAYNIVGIPIASGVLLPFTGTILTPSIAGALMGLSSVGVMTNSLLLRLKFSSNLSSGVTPPNSENHLASDLVAEEDK